MHREVPKKKYIAECKVFARVTTGACKGKAIRHATA
jgi:hypothetical protein